MKAILSLDEARELLLSRCGAVETETAELSAARWRILARDVHAAADVPPFRRSPYDGYAFRAADSAGASPAGPVTLRVVENIAAGQTPRESILPGTAARIMTGAPIPEGADTVVKYEDTEFTADAVTLFSPSSSGKNIVPAGEDVAAGALIARRGEHIDPGLAGMLAAQGLVRVPVFKKPRVGVISTGNEVVEADEPVSGPFIRNSNRYSLEAACVRAGAEPVYLGRVGDDARAVAALLGQGVERCDMVLVTGGASVGDLDFTPAALELVGADILVRGVRMKPGGACAHGVKDGRLVFGLSGNPSSAMINFYTLALPCLRRICGYAQALPGRIRVALADGFGKKSPVARVVCGRLDLSDGAVRMRIAAAPGSGALRSLVGCDAVAVIPAGSPPLAAGAMLDAYLLD